MDTEQQIEKRHERSKKKSIRKRSTNSKKSSTKSESSHKKARQASHTINHGEHTTPGLQSLETPQRGVTNTIGSPP